MSATVTDLNVRRGYVPQWEFADRIRKVRRDMRATQATFAKMLDVGEKRYAAWESGLNTPDDLPDICVRLEVVTGVARGWFLGWLETPTFPDGRARRDSNPQPSDPKVHVLRPLSHSVTDAGTRAA